MEQKTSGGKRKGPKPYLSRTKKELIGMIRDLKRDNHYARSRVHAVRLEQNQKIEVLEKKSDHWRMMTEIWVSNSESWKKESIYWQEKCNRLDPIPASSLRTTERPQKATEGNVIYLAPPAQR